jgi:hypothetical protein
MDSTVIYIISIFGALTLVGIFWKMKPGIGVFNLRAFGIVLIATFSGILALQNPEALIAAMGIFGAIAGYLFGAEDKSTSQSNVEAQGNKFGNNAKIAGRDINETIEKLEGSISNIQEAVINQNQYLSNLQKTVKQKSFLINTIYQRSHTDIEQALDSTISKRLQEGWSLAGFSSDYQGMDGIFLVFEKEASEDGSATVIYHHGSI